MEVTNLASEFSFLRLTQLQINFRYEGPSKRRRVLLLKKDSDLGPIQEEREEDIQDNYSLKRKPPHKATRTPSGMKIRVKRLDGSMFYIEVSKSDTIKNVKIKIQEVQGTCPYEQRILFQGKQLEDDFTLSYYDIPDDATFYLILRLRGC